MSQKVAGSNGGISQQVLSQLERGELNAQVEVVLRACLAVGAEPGEVLQLPKLHDLRQRFAQSKKTGKRS